MSESFDPYHRWLGIPPKDQPPNHYRLLGIDPFEDNLDVIEAAADRQMGHLRTYQTGKHAALSQQLLNEVAAAKVCLLNPRRKAAYDESLRQKSQGDYAWLTDDKPASFVPTPAPSLSATDRASPIPPPIHRIAARRPFRRPILIASAIAATLALALVFWIATRDDKPPGSSASKPRPSSRPPAVAAGKAARPVPSHRHSTTALRPSRSVDLLQLIDLARDTRRQSGWPAWRREGSVLVMPPGNALLEIPYSAPEEYDLKVVVKREGEAAVRPFVIMPVAGGRTFQIQFDFDALHRLCIANYDGRWTTITNHAIFESGKYSTIICRIRRSGFSILADGQLIADRKGGYSRYSPDPAFLAKDPSHPMIASFTSTAFYISQLELTPIGPP